MTAEGCSRLKRENREGSVRERVRRILDAETTGWWRAGWRE